MRRAFLGILSTAVILVRSMSPAQDAGDAAAFVPLDNPGDEVVVVYNSNLKESQELADYYAAQRGVPRSQVLGFKLSTNEAITRTEFRDDLQQPLLNQLKKSKLWTFDRVSVTDTNGKRMRIEKVVKSGIRYAVLCYGVPLKIKADETLTTGNATVRPEFRRNEAAVDTELAWLPMVYQHPSLVGPMRNPVYTVTNGSVIHPTNGILMVTRLDGPTPQIARGLVDKAIHAETDGLWGRAYFDLWHSKDQKMKLGDEWIQAAAGVCRIVGFPTIVDTNEAVFDASFPMSHIAFYAGWYAANANGPFALPDVEFMPGAFAYHLHSFSASTIRSTTAHWVGPLLAKGATITMGCVEEPYLGGTPDVGAFTGRLLFYRFSFGEAAYAAQPVLSWQTTIVGDPLYRPAAKLLPQLHVELQAKQSPLVDMSHLRVVELAAVKAAPAAQILAYLEQVTNTASSAVLSEKLGDVCTAMGKPSSAIFAYERALDCDPSRQQRVRLRLTLAEKLIEAGEDTKAYEQYRALIEKDWPQYPGRLDVARKLLPLALKLDKTSDAAKWETLIQQLSPPPQAPAARAGGTNK